MADYPRELEVQRLMNLAINFGWEKIKEEVQGQDVIVTLRKKVLAEEVVTSPAPPT